MECPYGQVTLPRSKSTWRRAWCMSRQWWEKRGTYADPGVPVSCEDQRDASWWDDRPIGCHTAMECECWFQPCEKSEDTPRFQKCQSCCWSTSKGQSDRGERACMTTSWRRRRRTREPNNPWLDCSVRPGDSLQRMSPGPRAPQSRGEAQSRVERLAVERLRRRCKLPGRPMKKKRMGLGKTGAKESGVGPKTVDGSLCQGGPRWPIPVSWAEEPCPRSFQTTCRAGTCSWTPAWTLWKGMYCRLNWEAVSVWGPWKKHWGSTGLTQTWEEEMRRRERHLATWPKSKKKKCQHG